MLLDVVLLFSCFTFFFAFLFVSLVWFGFGLFDFIGRVLFAFLFFSVTGVVQHAGLRRWMI